MNATHFGKGSGKVNKSKLQERKEPSSKHTNIQTDLVSLKSKHNEKKAQSPKQKEIQNGLVYPDISIQEKNCVLKEKTNKADNNYKIMKSSGTILISDSDDEISQARNENIAALELNVCQKRTMNRRLGRKKVYVEGNNLESTDCESKINLTKDGNKTHIESNVHQKREYVEGNNLESTKTRRYEKGISNTAVVIKMMNEYGLNDIYLPVEKSCRLANMKKCYAETFQIPIYSLRFFFDGQRVNDWDTPEDLEVDNGDVIEVYRDFDSEDLRSIFTDKSGAVSLVGNHQSRAEALYEDMTRVIELLSSDEETEDVEHNPSDGEEQACSNSLENAKYNYVFIELETMVAGDSQSKEITQIGGYKENSMDGAQAQFFKAIEPKKLNYYLENYKLGGDLLQTLHIQKNESGKYEFRKPFEVMEEGRMAIQCVSEEEALEDLSSYLASVENCVIFSLCEANIELLIQRMKFFGVTNRKIRMDTIKGFCSWKSFLKEEAVFKEVQDKEFEEWYDDNVKNSSTFESAKKHAEAVAKMVHEAIEMIRTLLGSDRIVTEDLVKASQPIKSLISKQFPDEVQQSQSQIQYLELFSSLRPDFPVSISLKKMETYDISEDADGDTRNGNVLNVEIEKEDVLKGSGNPSSSLVNKSAGSERRELNGVITQDAPSCISISSLTSAPAQVASEITIPPSTCTICNKKFWTVSSKNEHIILEHNPNEVDQMPILPMELQCPTCYKWLCSKEAKLKHLCSLLDIPRRCFFPPPFPPPPFYPPPAFSSLRRIPLFLKCQHCQTFFNSYREKIEHVLMCRLTSRGRRSRSSGRKSMSCGRRSSSRGHRSRLHGRRSRSRERRSRSNGRRSRSRTHRRRSRSCRQKSRSQGRRTRSRERRSRSRGRRSRSREHRSRISGRRSRSRGRTSSSRELRSRSRGRRSRSRGRRSRSREGRSRSRGHRSKSREYRSKVYHGSMQFMQEIQKLGVKFGVNICVDEDAVGGTSGLQNYVAGLVNIVTKQQSMLPQLRQNMGDNQQNNVGNQQNYVGNEQNSIGSQQNSIGSQQNSIGNKQNSIGNKQNSVGNKQNSVGNKQNSVGNQQNNVSNQQNSVGNKKNSVDNQQNNVSNQENSVGNKQISVDSQQNYVRSQQNGISNKYESQWNRVKYSRWDVPESTTSRRNGEEVARQSATSGINEPERSRQPGLGENWNDIFRYQNKVFNDEDVDNVGTADTSNTSRDNGGTRTEEDRMEEPMDAIIKPAPVQAVVMQEVAKPMENVLMNNVTGSSLSTQKPCFGQVWGS